MRRSDHFAFERYRACCTAIRSTNVQPYCGHRILDGRRCFCGAVVHRTLFASFGLPLIDAVEILTAFLILKSRERLPLQFRGVRSLMSFSMAAIAACAAAATLAGIVSSPSHKFVDAHALFSLFVGHLLGLLTVTPALIRFLRRPKKVRQTPSFYERYGLLGLLVVLTAAVITSYQAPFGFVLLPILITIAYRLGPRDTSAAVLLVSANGAAVHGAWFRSGCEDRADLAAWRHAAASASHADNVSDGDAAGRNDRLTSAPQSATVGGIGLSFRY